MSNPASVVADGLASRARGLDLYLNRIEKLHSLGKLSSRDIERAHAGGFLEFHAYLERSIERLFLGLLRERLHSSHQSARPLIKVQADKVAYEVITGVRKYVDWLPYKSYTLPRAESFFASGKPFSTLDNSDISALDNISVIRNALAHQSTFAMRQFKKKFIEGRNIPPAQHRPPAYLRGNHTVGQTRMNYLMGCVVITMRKLCR